MHSVVLHSHFYQPPREDPWLEEIEREPDAGPYHDWTTRVAQECYRGLAAARVLDGEGRIRRVVNTFAHGSFDVGPSLMSWLERHMPAVYAGVLDGDRASARRSGHGNAIAHPYDHVVLPLCSRRDKVTEVRWGIADFRRRFGRPPEGMWLPETAVDDETLDVLAEQAIRFTVLAPEQVTNAPTDGAPGRYITEAGREIALFAYDGGLSRDIAFGGLLRDGHRLAELLVPNVSDEPRLVAVATDGETYGHHHRFGDMALAAAMDLLDRHPRARMENFAAYLARRPAERAVGIVSPSAWSCVHGVDRWRADCGCRVAPGGHHRWRAPLREAVDGLVADVHALFEREGSALFGDPWIARDRYEGGDGPSIPPIDADGPSVEPQEVRARELLEMERHALRAQTSSAWFYDDVARPESLIALRSAARAIELAGAAGAAMEGRLLAGLARAESNDTTIGTARDIYLRRARPTRTPAVRVAAGYAAVRRFGAHGDAELPGAWSASSRGAMVLLVERRTGRRHAFEVLVDVPGHGSPDASARSANIRLADVDPRAITVLVRRESLDGAPRGAPESAPLGTALKLPDLPDRARHAVELAVRRAVIHRLLTDEERAQLAAGEVELGPLVSAALRRAVRHLAEDSSPAAVARVLGLADLRESLRGVPPFDAQTAFHLVRAAALPDVAARLAPVARRLGFSPRVWEARVDDPDEVE